MRSLKRSSPAAFLALSIMILHGAVSASHSGLGTYHVPVWMPEYDCGQDHNCIRILEFPYWGNCNSPLNGAVVRIGTPVMIERRRDRECDNLNLLSSTSVTLELAEDADTWNPHAFVLDLRSLGTETDLTSGTMAPEVFIESVISCLRKDVESTEKQSSWTLNLLTREDQPERWKAYSGRYPGTEDLNAQARDKWEFESVEAFTYYVRCLQPSRNQGLIEAQFRSAEAPSRDYPGPPRVLVPERINSIEFIVHGNSTYALATARTNNMKDSVAVVFQLDRRGKKRYVTGFRTFSAAGLQTRLECGFIESEPTQKVDLREAPIEIITHQRSYDGKETYIREPVFFR